MTRGIFKKIKGFKMKKVKLNSYEINYNSLEEIIKELEDEINTSIHNHKSLSFVVKIHLLDMRKVFLTKEKSTSYKTSYELEKIIKQLEELLNEFIKYDKDKDVDSMITFHDTIKLYVKKMKKILKGKKEELR